MDAIFATDETYGFGYRNVIPWKCVEDMRRFKTITMAYSYVIVGRSTFLSMGPLKGRKMIVVCQSPEQYQKIETRPEVQWMTLEEALKLNDAIIIGGKAILEAAWQHINLIMLSTIYGHYPRDTYLIPDLSEFKCLTTCCLPDHKFSVYKRVQ